MSLRNKLFIYTMVISTLFTASMIYDRVISYKRNVYEVYTAKAETLSSALAELSAIRLGSRGGKGLKETLDAFDHLPSLLYLRVSDTAGRVLYKSAEPGIKVGDRAVDRDIAEISDGVYDIEKELLYEDGTVGYMRMGVSVGPLRENIENMFWRGAVLGAAFLLLLAAVLRLITRRMGADMEMLSEAAGSVGKEALPPLPSAPPGSDVWRIAGALENLHRELAEERQLRKETEEVKNDFFAMAVHDLKQPVTILKAVHQLILEATREAGAAVKKDVARVAYLSTSSMDRLNGMINDMLSIAKLSSPDIPVEKDRIVLGDFLKECAAEYSPAAAAAGKNWEFDRGGVGQDRWIFGDRELLRRLVGNLVLNAIHYTPEGGTIRLGARLASGSRAEIFVSDEGAGIPEGFRGEIFKKYSSLSRSARNVGLGLAFCKIVADRHSALIGVRSEEGKGTEISLAIPVSGEGSGQQ